MRQCRRPDRRRHPTVSDGLKSGQSRQQQLEDYREDDPIQDYLKQRGRQMVSTDPPCRLQPQDDRQKDWETENVVEIIMNEPTADMARLEYESPEQINRHRADADRIVNVPKGSEPHQPRRWRRFSGHCECIWLRQCEEAGHENRDHRTEDDHNHRMHDHLPARRKWPFKVSARIVSGEGAPTFQALSAVRLIKVGVAAFAVLVFVSARPAESSARKTAASPVFSGAAATIGRGYRSVITWGMNDPSFIRRRELVPSRTMRRLDRRGNRRGEVDLSNSNAISWSIRRRQCVAVHGSRQNALVCPGNGCNQRDVWCCHLRVGARARAEDVMKQNHIRANPKGNEQQEYH